MQRIPRGSLDYALCTLEGDNPVFWKTSSCRLAEHISSLAATLRCARVLQAVGSDVLLHLWTLIPWTGSQSQGRHNERLGVPRTCRTSAVLCPKTPPQRRSRFFFFSNESFGKNVGLCVGSADRRRPHVVILVSIKATAPRTVYGERVFQGEVP